MWTQTVLDPPPALQAVLAAAHTDPQLADQFAQVFTRPADMPALLDRAITPALAGDPDAAGR
jgi:hypothetical protein